MLLARSIPCQFLLRTVPVCFHNAAGRAWF